MRNLEQAQDEDRISGKFYYSPAKFCGPVLIVVGVALCFTLATIYLWPTPPAGMSIVSMPQHQTSEGKLPTDLQMPSTTVAPPMPATSTTPLVKRSSAVPTPSPTVKLRPSLVASAPLEPEANSVDPVRGFLEAQLRQHWAQLSTQSNASGFLRAALLYVGEHILGSNQDAQWSRDIAQCAVQIDTVQKLPQQWTPRLLAQLLLPSHADGIHDSPIKKICMLGIKTRTTDIYYNAKCASQDATQSDGSCDDSRFHESGEPETEEKRIRTALKQAIQDPSKVTAHIVSVQYPSTHIARLRLDLSPYISVAFRPEKPLFERVSKGLSTLQAELLQYHVSLAMEVWNVPATVPCKVPQTLLHSMAHDALGPKAPAYKYLKAPVIPGSCMMWVGEQLHEESARDVLHSMRRLARPRYSGVISEKDISMSNFLLSRFLTGSYDTNTCFARPAGGANVFSGLSPSEGMCQDPHPAVGGSSYNQQGHFADSQIQNPFCRNYHVHRCSTLLSIDNERTSSNVGYNSSSILCGICRFRQSSIHKIWDWDSFSASIKTSLQRAVGADLRAFDRDNFISHAVNLVKSNAQLLDRVVSYCLSRYGDLVWLPESAPESCFTKLDNSQGPVPRARNHKGDVGVLEPS